MKNDTGALYRARDWCILVQRPMRSDAVIVMGVTFQNATQMRLAQDNDVVHTLTPDRSDQPFSKAILPRRGWRNGLIADAHGTQSACDDGAVDPIAVTDHVAWSFTHTGEVQGSIPCAPTIKPFNEGCFP
jgi:hypothetical protein